VCPEIISYPEIIFFYPEIISYPEITYLSENLGEVLDRLQSGIGKELWQRR